MTFVSALDFLELQIIDYSKEPVHNDLDNSQTRFLNYCLSTRVRQLFIMWCIRAEMTDAPISVRDLLQKNFCSRPALDKMIAECSEEGWITVSRGQHNHRHLIANDLPVRLFKDYYQFWKDQVAIRTSSSECERPNNIRMINKQKYAS